MAEMRKWIGSGHKRNVYDFSDGKVLKVAKSRAGYQSNKTEYLIYHTKKAFLLRKHLAEVVNCKYKYKWLIMKKYDRPFYNSNKNYKEYLKLKRRFRQQGIIPRDMYSMTHKGPSLTNLRLNRKGEIVVIDYGNFKFMPRSK